MASPRQSEILRSISPSHFLWKQVWACRWSLIQDCWFCGNRNQPTDSFHLSGLILSIPWSKPTYSSCLLTWWSYTILRTVLLCQYCTVLLDTVSNRMTSSCGFPFFRIGFPELSALIRTRSSFPLCRHGSSHVPSFASQVWKLQYPTNTSPR